MITINDYFDQIYVVNLDDRPDRLKSATKALNSIGVSFKRIPGLRVSFSKIDPSKYTGYEQQNERYVAGQYGCKLGHLSAVLDAHKNGYEKVLIMEDDVQVLPDANEIFDEGIKLLEDSQLRWEMLYLGARYEFGGFCEDGTRWWQEYIGHRMLKLRGAMLATAYGLTRNTCAYILENAIQSPYEIDLFYCKQVYYGGIPDCYGILPPIMSQSDSHSDIQDQPTSL